MKKIIAITILGVNSSICFSQGFNKPDVNPSTYNQPLSPIISVTLPAAYTNTLYNYTRQWLPTVPLKNENDATFDLQPPSTLNLRAVLVSNYMDGWGKPIETILRRGGMTNSLTANDIVAFSNNQASSVQKTFLPYKASEYSKFQANPFNSWQSYYSGSIENGCEFSQMDPNAYIGLGLSKPVPTIKEYAPGSSFVGNTKGITTQLNFDDGSSNIMHIRANASGIPELVLNNPQTGYTYIGGQLTIKSTISQHSKVDLQYYNREGMLICSKENSAETYYIYNEMGRLTYILPPKAVEAFKNPSVNWNFAGTSGQTILQKLCFKYIYDRNGNLIEQNVPGKTSVDRFVHDTKGRMVLYQTPLLANDNKWAFTIYDKANRPVVEGIYTNADNWTRQYMEDVLCGRAFPSITVGSTWDYFINGMSNVYPTSLPNCDIRGYYYYDHYSHGALGSPSFDNSFSGDYITGVAHIMTPVPSYSVHGLATGSKVKIVDNASGFSNPWVTTVYYYDREGRNIQTQTVNPWQTVNKDVMTRQYDFSGNMALEIYNHHIIGAGTSAKPTVKIQTKYDYDHIKNGRFVSSRHKIDNGAWMDMISGVEYDELSRIKKLSIGQIETQEYEYNVRGQLKSINKDHLSIGATIPNKSFGEEMHYDYGFTKPRYDGNISGLTWRSNGAGAKQRAYGYEYDNYYRLKHAEFNELNLVIGSYQWNKFSDYTVSNLNYDINGNISSMKQRGMALVGGSMTPVDMDILSYSYTANSNQLSSVNDAVNKTTNVGYNLGDFINENTTTDYQYDADGNIIQDLNRFVNNIAYNYFDEPTTVQVIKSGNTSTITNTYDAEGSLLKKEIIHAGTTTTYQYWGPIVYKNGQIEHIMHDQGRARKTTDGYEYDFFIKDHLDNVRVVKTAQVSSGVTYHAGFELAYAHLEEGIFGNLADVRDNKPLASPNDLLSGRLNGSEPGKEIGATVLVHAMAGDQLELRAYGYYEQYDSTEMTMYTMPETMAAQLLNTLSTGNFGVSNGETNIPGVNPTSINALLSPSNYNLYDVMKQNATDPTYPRAYLNYLVFDESFQLMPEYSNVTQLRGGANTWLLMDGDNQRMAINGYVLAYLSNESGISVFVDNESLITINGQVQEEQHYYPHGLVVWGGGQSTTPLRSKYLYQSNILQDEAGLQISDFNFRNYDHQIGRFMSVDPLADGFGQEVVSPYQFCWNNPGNMTDPLGLGNGDGDKGPTISWGMDNILTETILWMPWWQKRAPLPTAPVTLHATQITIPLWSGGTQEQHYIFNEAPGGLNVAPQGPSSGEMSGQNIGFGGGGGGGGSVGGSSSTVTASNLPKPRIPAVVTPENQWAVALNEVTLDLMPILGEVNMSFKFFTGKSLMGTEVDNSNTTLLEAMIPGKFKIKFPARNLPLKEEADALGRALQRNSVHINTQEGRMRFDLRSSSPNPKPHRGVPIPHVQRRVYNTDRAGTVHDNVDSKFVRPMTKQDVDAIRKYIKKYGVPAKQ